MVGTYERVKENTSINGYGVVGYEFGAEDEVLAKTIYLRSAEDTTRWSRGIDGEDNAKERVIMEWVEREFASQQFTGHHLLDVAESEHTVDWRAGYSLTSRYEPDRRTYTYLNNTLATSAIERRWSDLEENSVDAGLDYGHSFDWGSDNITCCIQTKIALLICSVMVCVLVLMLHKSRFLQVRLLRKHFLMKVTSLTLFV
jgi:hypothetical protein